MKIRVVLRVLSTASLLITAPAASGGKVLGQALTWDGHTGAVFTPYSHTAESPADGFGRPTVAFHLLDAGDVLGIHSQTSLTIGFRSRMEIGLTRSSVSSVGPQPVASLFDRGFTTLHAKARVLAGATGSAFRPDVSVGGVYRWQKEHIGADVVPAEPTQSGEVYLVATETFALSEPLAVLVNGGARATRSSFFGVAGVTPSWEVRAFASGGLLLGERLMVGGEYVQQPDRLDGFPSARVPATVAFFARGYPMASGRLNLDLALVRIAGVVAPGLDLRAENRLAFGTSFRF